MNIAPIRLALLLTWTVSLAASDDLPEDLEQERFEQAHALFAESAAGALSVAGGHCQLGEYSGRGAARVEQIQDRPVTIGWNSPRWRWMPVSARVRTAGSRVSAGAGRTAAGPICGRDLGGLG